MPKLLVISVVFPVSCSSSSYHPTSSSLRTLMPPRNAKKDSAPTGVKAALSGSSRGKRQRNSVVVHSGSTPGDSGSNAASESAGIFYLFNYIMS